LHRTLDHIRNQGVNAGVVINPATPVQMLEDVLDMVDHVLVMSVNPGFSGQKFIPNSLAKARKLAMMRAARNASFRIEMDGGIGEETIAEAVLAGVEVLVAGSAVFGHGNPKENSQRLLKLAREANLQKV
jgi:ribulose-phosphate 3-epimerase